LNEQGIRRELDQAPVTLLARMQRFLCVSPLNSKLRLPQSPVHRRGQRGQPMFQNEVSRPALERFNRHFFSKRTRHKDKWHVRRLFLRQGKGGETVKSRQAMVGQDHRRFEAPQLAQEAILGLHPPKREIKAFLLQGVFHQAGVVRLILDH
jgi:hypothetical protein